MRSGRAFADEFRGRRLGPEWGSPYAVPPSTRIDRARGGRLVLVPARGRAGELDGGVVGRRPTKDNFTATAQVDLRSLRGGTRGGLVAYQDELTSLGVSLGAREVLVWRRVNGKLERRATLRFKPGGASAYLRMSARGRRAHLAVSADGRRWIGVGRAQDRSFLRSFRIGLASGGASRAAARFERFSYAPGR